jgi:hypothetical protein
VIVNKSSQSFLTNITRETLDSLGIELIFYSQSSIACKNTHPATGPSFLFVANIYFLRYLPRITGGRRYLSQMPHFAPDTGWCFGEREVPQMQFAFPGNRIHFTCSRQDSKPTITAREKASRPSSGG